MNNTDTAFALLRWLYAARYDAGGESQRSLKSYLLDGIIIPYANAAIEKGTAGYLNEPIDTTFEGLSEIRKEFKGKCTPVPLGDEEKLEELPEDQYWCMILIFMLRIVAEGENPSQQESDLLETALMLLGIPEDRTAYEQLADSYDSWEAVRNAVVRRSMREFLARDEAEGGKW